MMLTTEDLGDIPEIDPKRLDDVLSADGFGKFAVLAASDHEYIQAGNDWTPALECQAFFDQQQSDPWVLEYRQGGQQFRAAGHVTLEQVRATFGAYLAGDRTWKSGFSWAELKV